MFCCYLRTNLKSARGRCYHLLEHFNAFKGISEKVSAEEWAAAALVGAAVPSAGRPLGSAAVGPGGALPAIPLPPLLSAELECFLLLCWQQGPCRKGLGFFFNK